ncbi:MAG: site-2 protease family protein [Terriglobales bacterium]
MRSQIRLGRIAGISIGLHYSWFIIAFLIAFSLVAQFHSVSPSWNSSTVWAAAIITSVLFFVSLLLHELAHSALAQAKGLRVREITLFALGGISQIETEPTSAKSEFWIAVVGPATSVAIGFLLFGLARVLGWAPGGQPRNPPEAVLLWLAYINVALGLFNLIPGYPLDGGRILRAILWWITGKVERATRIAARTGEGVAFVFILLGLYRFFVGANFAGLWLAFIGWFLLEASRSSYARVELMSELHGHRVAELMEHDCIVVDGSISVRDFVEEYLLHTAHRCFLVNQNQRTAGIVTPNEIKAVSREEWSRTSLQSVMRPLHMSVTVAPDMPADKALELMAKEGVTQLPVVSDGHVEGLFSQNQIFKFLQFAARGR